MTDSRDETQRDLKAQREAAELRTMLQLLTPDEQRYRFNTLWFGILTATALLGAFVGVLVTRSWWTLAVAAVAWLAGVILVSSISTYRHGNPKRFAVAHRRDAEL